MDVYILRRLLAILSRELLCVLLERIATRATRETLSG